MEMAFGLVIFADLGLSLHLSNYLQKDLKLQVYDSRAAELRWKREGDKMDEAMIDVKEE